jgi:hypothetical protein
MSNSRDHLEAVEAIVSGLQALPEWARFGMAANRMSAEVVLSALRSAGFMIVKARADAASL